MFHPTSTNPPHIVDETEKWDEPKWNPKVHLASEMPDEIMLFGSEESEGDLVPAKLPCPPPRKRDQRSRLAYCQPFQLLSEKGVEDFKKVVEYHTKNTKRSETNGRVPVSIQGLAYRSKFVRDFNTCPEVRERLSTIAGIPMVPSTFQCGGWSHVNVTEPNGPSDKFHADSVPYVLITVLNDMSEAVGGDLEVVRKAPYDAAYQRIVQTNGQLPKDELLAVKNRKPGCAILVCGSQLAHRVTPIISAPEARISVVNSYQSADPMCPDDTRLDFFRLTDSKSAYHQYARHRALRTKALLEEFLESPEWIEDPVRLARVLKEHAQYLAEGADTLTGVRDDTVPFFKEKGTELSANNIIKKEKEDRAEELSRSYLDSLTKSGDKKKGGMRSKM